MALNDQQVITLIVLAITFILFIWDRFRYDLVALMSLLALVILQVVPAKTAFSNFGHPALISVASVLILSKAVGNTGLTFYIAKYIIRFVKRPSLVILSLTLLVAILSGFMNDVGALALTIPIALQVARRNKIPISHILMPMSFASLLGGVTTLIGTPPNIIISSYRATLEGKTAFSFFDYSYVGVISALFGILYIAFLGWRLLPNREKPTLDKEFISGAYIVEIPVHADSKFIKKPLLTLQEAMENQVSIVALLRGDIRILAPSPHEILRPNDLLLMEGQPEAFNTLKVSTDLEFSPHTLISEELQSGDIELLEVVINAGSHIANQTVAESKIREYYGINILGIAREGESIKHQFAKVRLRVGDILLIQIPQNQRIKTLNEIGCLPLKDRKLALAPSAKLLPTLAIFLGAVALVAFNILPIYISFPLAVSLLLACKLLTLNEAYQNIEGSLIVLLGCFITVGSTLETTGLTALMTKSLMPFLIDLPNFIILGMILFICMVMTDLINNSAAAVIMGPLAASIATSLGHSVDPYLILVAIGCSCAFNTPFGHHCNTIVMTVGNYKFTDYFRMGFLLDIILLIVAVPSVMYFWPL